MNIRTIAKKISIGFSLAMISGLVFFSCDYSYLDGLSTIEDYTYDPVVAVPLVSSAININDLIDLNDINLIEVDEENLITLVYRGEIFSIDASSIFTVPDQLHNISFENIPVPENGLDTIISHPFLLTFTNSEIITYISFLSGQFSVSAESDLMAQDGYTLDANFRIINSFDSNGNPIQGSVSLDSPANIDLTGSTINMGEAANFFLVEYTLSISGNGTPTNAPYTVNFNQSVNNIQYDLLKGYIDQISFPIGSTTVPVDIFTNANIGDVVFENPSIDFAITNSFGTPIDVIIDQFYAVGLDNEIINVTGTGIDTPWRINYPSEPEMDAVVTYKTINNQNSNLFQITQQTPKEIFYDVNGLTNPDGVVQALNWVKHDSNMTIDIDFNLPLWGRIENYSMQDTLGIGIDTIPEEIEWLEAKLILSNGFPIDLDINLLLMDENNIVIDTLFKDYDLLVAGGNVNPSTGLVTDPTSSQIIEFVDEATIQNLLLTEKVIVDARLKTQGSENETSVKILDSYELGVDLGIRAKARSVIELEINE
jgi:hypothetical protein